MRRLLIILIAGFCCAAFAQNECRVTTSLGAIDKQGHFVVGLKAEQVHIVLHGGVQPSHVALEERDDHHVAILLDNSGSMYGGTPYEKNFHGISVRAASDILRNLRPQTTVRLTVFSAAATTAEGVEAALTMLTKATKPVPKQGRTALWQSIYDAALGMKDGGTIIAITDGGENHSKVGLGELEKTLRANHVRVIVLLLENDKPARLEDVTGPDDCFSLVAATGGEVLPLRGDGALTPVAVREMLHDYGLSFTAPREAAKSKWRIAVDTGNHAIDKNVSLRTVKSLPGCDSE